MVNNPRAKIRHNSREHYQQFPKLALRGRSSGSTWATQVLINSDASLRQKESKIGKENLLIRLESIRVAERGVGGGQGGRGGGGGRR